MTTPSQAILARLRIGSLYGWEVDALSLRLGVRPELVRAMEAAHQQLTAAATPVQAPLGMGPLGLDSERLVRASEAYNAAARALDGGMP